MQAIRLTPEQADAVRGEVAPGYELSPVLMTDGDYMLPARVLTDPGYAPAHDTLAAFPQFDYIPAPSNDGE